MEQVKIRRMTLDDIETVVAIEARAYGEHHWSDRSFYNEITNDLAHYFCAVDESGQIIGYSGCWYIFEETHITTLAVAPEHRRKSIGEALLVNIINDCRANKMKYITLEVRVSNTAAIKLYEKYAFTSLGERKNYYQDNNEDALVMWTENIFYDKFSKVFEENIKQLKVKIV